MYARKGGRVFLEFFSVNPFSLEAGGAIYQSPRRSLLVVNLLNQKFFGDIYYMSYYISMCARLHYIANQPSPAHCKLYINWFIRPPFSLFTAISEVFKLFQNAILI